MSSPLAALTGRRARGWTGEKGHAGVGARPAAGGSAATARDTGCGREHPDGTRPFGGTPLPQRPDTSPQPTSTALTTPPSGGTAAHPTGPANTTPHQSTRTVFTTPRAFGDTALPARGAACRGRDHPRPLHHQAHVRSARPQACGPALDRCRGPRSCRKPPGRPGSPSRPGRPRNPPPRASRCAVHPAGSGSAVRRARIAAAPVATGGRSHGPIRLRGG